MVDLVDAQGPKRVNARKDAKDIANTGYKTLDIAVDFLRVEDPTPEEAHRIGLI